MKVRGILMGVKIGSGRGRLWEEYISQKISRVYMSSRYLTTSGVSCLADRRSTFSAPSGLESVWISFIGAVAEVYSLVLSSQKHADLKPQTSL